MEKIMKLQNNIWNITKEDHRLLIESPYSEHMNNILKSINARWQNPYWIAFEKDYDLIVNELTYFFGAPEDLPVDLKIEVGELTIRDRLFVAGKKCIEVDVLEKKFMQTNSLYIYEKYDFDNWEKTIYPIHIATNFFTRLLVRFFRPFKIKNCTFLLSNISQTRAKNFIDANYQWVKSASIVPAKDSNFNE